MMKTFTQKNNKNKTLREPDNKHLAPFILVAHITYKDDNDNVINKTDMIVDHCFTKQEAKKSIKEIQKTKVLKHVGFGPAGPIMEEGYSPAPKISAIRADGKRVTEYIDSFSILEKGQYGLYQPRQTN